MIQHLTRNNVNNSSIGPWESINYIKTICSDWKSVELFDISSYAKIESRNKCLVFECENYYKKDTSPPEQSQKKLSDNSTSVLSDSNIKIESDESNLQSETRIEFSCQPPLQPQPQSQPQRTHIKTLHNNNNVNNNQPIRNRPPIDRFKLYGGNDIKNLDSIENQINFHLKELEMTKINLEKDFKFKPPSSRGYRVRNNPLVQAEKEESLNDLNNSPLDTSRDEFIVNPSAIYRSKKLEIMNQVKQNSRISKIHPNLKSSKSVDQPDYKLPKPSLSCLKTEKSSEQEGGSSTKSILSRSSSNTSSYLNNISNQDSEVTTSSRVVAYNESMNEVEKIRRQLKEEYSQMINGSSIPRVKSVNFNSRTGQFGSQQQMRNQQKPSLENNYATHLKDKLKSIAQKQYQQQLYYTSSIFPNSMPGSANSSVLRNQRKYISVNTDKNNSTSNYSRQQDTEMDNYPIEFEKSITQFKCDSNNVYSAQSSFNRSLSRFINNNSNKDVNKTSNSRLTNNSKNNNNKENSITNFNNNSTFSMNMNVSNNNNANSNTLNSGNNNLNYYTSNSNKQFLIDNSVSSNFVQSSQYFDPMYISGKSYSVPDAINTSNLKLLNSQQANKLSEAKQRKFKNAESEIREIQVKFNHLTKVGIKLKPAY